MGKKMERDCMVDPQTGMINHKLLDEDTLPRINSEVIEGDVSLADIGIYPVPEHEVRSLIDTVYNEEFYGNAGCITDDPESIHVQDDISLDDI
jgi:hypothetical protein